MAKRIKTLAAFLNSVPGKKTLGIYRFLPIFFVLGAALEFSMINWHAGQVNFCKYFTYKNHITYNIYYRCIPP